MDVRLRLLPSSLTMLIWLQLLLLFLHPQRSCSTSAATAASDTSCEFQLPFSVGGEQQQQHQLKQLTLGGEWKRLIEDSLFDDVSGYSIPLPNDELIELNSNASSEIKCQPSTFGEMNAIRFMKDQRFALGEGDIYFDLGSGLGKAVIGAVLLLNATEGWGVELSNVRHQQACTILQEKLPIVLQQQQRTSNEASSASASGCGRRCHERCQRPGKITLVQGNLLDIDLSRATAISVFATCFPPQLELALLQKFKRELQIGTRIYAPGISTWRKSDDNDNDDEASDEPTHHQNQNQQQKQPLLAEPLEGRILTPLYSQQDISINNNNNKHVGTMFFRVDESSTSSYSHSTTQSEL